MARLIIWSNIHLLHVNGTWLLSPEDNYAGWLRGALNGQGPSKRLKYLQLLLLVVPVCSSYAWNVYIKTINLWWIPKGYKQYKKKKETKKDRKKILILALEKFGWLFHQSIVYFFSFFNYISNSSGKTVVYLKLLLSQQTFPNQKDK